MRCYSGCQRSELPSTGDGSEASSSRSWECSSQEAWRQDDQVLPSCGAAAQAGRILLMRGHSALYLTLDVLKVDARQGRGRFASATTSNVKRVARTFKFNGLNMNNKMAVGVCSKYSCFETFECSRTKQEDRDLILKGEQKYFCSMFFMKNPKHHT